MRSKVLGIALLIAGFASASCKAADGGASRPVSARMSSSCTELSPAITAKVDDAARRTAAALEAAIQARGLHRAALPARWLPPQDKPRYEGEAVIEEVPAAPAGALYVVGELARRSKEPRPQLLSDGGSNLYVLKPQPERGDVEEIRVCGCEPTSGVDQSPGELGRYAIELPPGTSVKGDATIAYKSSLVLLRYENMRDGQPCEPAP